MKGTTMMAAAGIAATLNAAVPVAWTNSPGMGPYPVRPVPHGSTVDFAVTLEGYSDPPVAPGADVRLWYQTNGMGQAWWSAPATIEGGTITATFGPAQDCGADRVSLFFGAPSNVFASAVLRLTHAPGFTPNEIELPVHRLDFAGIEVANAPWPAEIAAAVAPVAAAVANAATAATNYTAAAIAEIPVPPPADFSRSNAALVATIEATAPAPGNYAAVSNAAMSAAAATNDFLRTSGGSIGYLRFPYFDDYGVAIRAQTPGALSFESSYPGYEGATATLDVSRIPIDEWGYGYDDIAFLSDIPDLEDYATTYEVSSSIRPVSNMVVSASETVSRWETYWGGSNVVFEVTNYFGNTTGTLPRLRIREHRDGAWTNVWDEVDKFNVCESQLVARVSASNEALRVELREDFAPRAWGALTDKGSTNVVGNSVWMTSPETYFAGGTEYQRVAVGAGAVCVLVDNGALSRTTGQPGTFRFQDDGGTNYFGFAKTDSYTIGCRTDGISVEGNLVTLRYDVIMGGTDVPIVYYRQSLASGDWVLLNNPDGTAADGAPYSVTWYQSGGSYYAAINCGSNASGFFKAETSVAGDVVWETNMRARLGGGIECTNTATHTTGVIRPSYNGSTVTWSWSAK